MTIGIYKITNPKGLVYIGQSVEIENRIYKYQTACCKNQTKIYRSIKKYGWASHSFDVIETCEYPELNDREIHYINLYDSVNNGLNLKFGGRSSLHTQEHKNKISKSLKGRKRLLCTVYKMRLGATGKLKTDEQKKAQSLSMHLNPNFLYNQRKIVLDTQSGVYYDSLKHAAYAFGLNYNTAKGRLNGSKPNNTSLIYA